MNVRPIIENQAKIQHVECAGVALEAVRQLLVRRCRTHEKVARALRRAIKQLSISARIISPRI